MAALSSTMQRLVAARVIDTQSVADVDPVGEVERAVGGPHPQGGGGVPQRPAVLEAHRGAGAGDPALAEEGIVGGEDERAVAALLFDPRGASGGAADHAVDRQLGTAVEKGDVSVGSARGLSPGCRSRR